MRVPRPFCCRRFWSFPPRWSMRRFYPPRRTARPACSTACRPRCGRLTPTAPVTRCATCTGSSARGRIRCSQSATASKRARVSASGGSFARAGRQTPTRRTRFGRSASRFPPVCSRRRPRTACAGTMRGRGAPRRGASKAGQMFCRRSRRCSAGKRRFPPEPARRARFLREAAGETVLTVDTAPGLYRGKYALLKLNGDDYAEKIGKNRILL